MCAASSGSLASYNSLTDEHLGDYFSNPRRLRHLRRMGLVTREGRLVEERVVRMRNARREHEMRCKDLATESVMKRAVEVEHKRQAELQEKLELLVKYEAVERIKSQKRHPFTVQSFNPYYTPSHPPPLRLSETLDKHANKLHLSDDQRTSIKQIVGSISRSKTIATPPKSPYTTTPIFSLSKEHTPSHVPRPPSAPKPKAAFTKRRSTVKNRPNTAPYSSRPQQASKGKQPNQHHSQAVIQHSDVRVTLSYVGPSLHLGGRGSQPPLADVLVLQQHCGGNTVTLFKGKVQPRERFTFTSRRHLGMPFGLAIYLDGMVDLRLSACCEYRHHCGKLLGSKTSHFRLVRVSGGEPCYRCQTGRSKRPVMEAFEPLNLEQTRQTENVHLGDLLREHLDESQPATIPTPTSPSSHQPLQSSSEIMTTSNTAQQRLSSQQEDPAIEAYSDDFSRSSSPVPPPDVEDIEDDSDSPLGSASQLNSLHGDHDRSSNCGDFHLQSKESIIESLESGDKQHSLESLQSGSGRLSTEALHNKRSSNGSVHSHTPEASLVQTSSSNTDIIHSPSSRHSSASSLHSEPIDGSSTSVQIATPLDDMQSKEEFTTTQNSDRDISEQNAAVDSTNDFSLSADNDLEHLEDEPVSVTNEAALPDVEGDTAALEPGKDLDDDKSPESNSTVAADQLNERPSSISLEVTTPVDPLSANVTLADAATMLKKTSSSDSLASLLDNDKSSLGGTSTVNLSESEDEDIPELEKRISEIIDSGAEEAIAHDLSEEVLEETSDIFERPPSRMDHYSEEIACELTPAASNDLLTNDHTELNNTEEHDKDLQIVTEGVISQVASSETLPELDGPSDIGESTPPTPESVALDDTMPEEVEECLSDEEDPLNIANEADKTFAQEADESDSIIEQAQDTEIDAAGSIDDVTADGKNKDFKETVNNTTKPEQNKKYSGTSESSSPVSMSSSLTSVTSTTSN